MNSKKKFVDYQFWQIFLSSSISNPDEILTFDLREWLEKVNENNDFFKPKKRVYITAGESLKSEDKIKTYKKTDGKIGIGNSTAGLRNSGKEIKETQGLDEDGRS